MHYRDPTIDQQDSARSTDPRLAFDEVTARVFPLKASMNRLQDFCDNYLNFVDESLHDRPAHYFKPAMPWVYCEVLNYGQMSTETSNRGWIAQHEIFFLVPLEWYVVRGDRLVFKDWAMVCPFIFVDNDMSVTTGREHYGWVKVRAWLDRLDADWADDPRRPRTLMNLRTRLFPRIYSGAPLELRSLLQVTQDPSPSVFNGPFGKSDMFGPSWSIPEALRTSAAFVSEAFEFLAGWPLTGYDPRSVPSAAEMLAQSARTAMRLVPWWQADRDSMSRAYARAHGRGPQFYLNQITLKQFRDAAEPELACYQALVSSRITIDHVYDGGLLGAARVAFGDVTGGIRLLLHDYPEQQIQSTLGLEVAEWRPGEDDERQAVLVPRLPFWARYDLRYDNGDTLCWRSKTSDWHGEPRRGTAPERGRANRFNPTRGAAIQELYGPFVFPDVTVRVFPLKADKAALQQYCDRYVNEHGDDDAVSGEALETLNGHRLEPWGDYVYMAVITHGESGNVAFSEHNNIGPIGDDQIVFYVPIKWYRQPVQAPGAAPAPPLTERNKADHLFKLGVLTPYVFGEGRQVVSEREVNGLPSLYGRLTGGPDAWLTTFRGQERSVLARLKTLLITAPHMGQPAREETLIEIVDVPEPELERLEAELDKAGSLPQAVARRLRDELGRLNYWIERAYGGLWRLVAPLRLRPRLVAYVAHLPLNCVSMKQLRSTAKEAGEPVDETASYKALVLVEKSIERLFAGGHWIDKRDWAYQRFVERLSDSIRVDIRYHENLDIAGVLGLQNARAVSRRGGAPVQEFRPERPFAMRLQLKEKLGANVMTRVRGRPWSEDVPVTRGAADRSGLERPNGPRRVWLESLAAADDPQRIIRDYVAAFAARKGRSPWP